MRPLPIALVLSMAPFLLFGAEDPAAEPPPADQPAAETSSSVQAPESAPDGMVWVPGGNYTRGESRKFPGNRAEYPEEKPVHRVTVDGFWLDETEVTNREFARFVEATGYQTQAERGWDRKDFPAAPDEQLRPGALCFTPPPQEVELFRPGAEWQWWRFISGANWRHPRGPGSDIEDKMDHPVVCVTHEDALAYCKWADKRLPTEAEWERAARGGLDHKIYVWGDEKRPNGKWFANVFQGDFPQTNLALDGFRGTSPVKSFPANSYGLYDMAGNVWEHCADLFRPDYYETFVRQEKLERNPKGPTEPVSQPMVQHYLQTGAFPVGEKPFHKLAWLWVTKGGSHLCHHTYCLRYRPAARHYSESLSPTNHTGFRCAKSKEQEAPGAP